MGGEIVTLTAVALLLISLLLAIILLVVIVKDTAPGVSLILIKI